MRRSVLVVAAVAGGVAAGIAFERWRSRRPARLDIYFDDGSFVTYVEGSKAADRLLPLAQQVLAAVHG